MDSITGIERADKFLGTGWAFPVTFYGGTHQLSTNSYEDNINDCIRIIMRTKKGERCFEPGFGADMQDFFFCTMNETLRGQIIDRLKTSLLVNEPRITVKEVDVVFTDIKNGRIDIAVKYIYNQTNTRHNFVFPFHLNEGTNLG